MSRLANCGRAKPRRKPCPQTNHSHPSTTGPTTTNTLSQSFWPNVQDAVRGCLLPPAKTCFPNYTWLSQQGNGLTVLKHSFQNARKETGHVNQPLKGCGLDHRVAASQRTLEPHGRWLDLTPSGSCPCWPRKGKMPMSASTHLPEPLSLALPSC